MTLEERAKKGAQLKAMGQCNCARSVLAAFEDKIDIAPEQADMLTAGFAAGMGNMEGTCGAVVGAVMVAGFLTEGKQTVRVSRGIMENFKEMSGSTICKELKGVTTGKMLTSCPDCVENAILALGNVLELE